MERSRGEDKVIVRETNNAVQRAAAETSSKIRAKVDTKREKRERA